MLLQDANVWHDQPHRISTISEKLLYPAPRFKRQDRPKRRLKVLTGPEFSKIHSGSVHQPAQIRLEVLF